MLTVSHATHYRLARLRRRTWAAIALCLILRLADVALEPAIAEPAGIAAHSITH